MMLKLMGPENLPDDNIAKTCKILDYVNEVTLRQNEETRESTLDVQYTRPNRELTSESFVLNANAYLMNDSGKTIQCFSPYVDSSKSKGVAGTEYLKGLIEGVTVLSKKDVENKEVELYVPNGHMPTIGSIIAHVVLNYEDDVRIQIYRGIPEIRKSSYFGGTRHHYATCVNEERGIDHHRAWSWIIHDKS